MVDRWTVSHMTEKRRGRAAQRDGVEIASVHEGGNLASAGVAGRRAWLDASKCGAGARASTIGTRKQTEHKLNKRDNQNDSSVCFGLLSFVSVYHLLWPEGKRGIPIAEGRDPITEGRLSEIRHGTGRTGLGSHIMKSTPHLNSRC